MVIWNEENAAPLLSRAGFGGDDRDGAPPFARSRQ
jgi:hypothetical protein